MIFKKFILKSSHEIQQSIVVERLDRKVIPISLKLILKYSSLYLSLKVQKRYINVNERPLYKGGIKYRNKPVSVLPFYFNFIKMRKWAKEFKVDYFICYNLLKEGMGKCHDLVSEKSPVRQGDDLSLLFKSILNFSD